MPPPRRRERLARCPSRSRPGTAGLLLFLALAVLCACSGVEEKRIRELLNEKGFGSRSQGVATLENYISGGDGVVFFLDPNQIVQPGYEQLALLAAPQQVGIDGTIHIPYIGNVPVLGLTERELEDLVQEQLQGLFQNQIQLTARIVNQGKAFYAFGEARRKGRLPLVKADLTFLEAISVVGTTRLANIGRIHLIRPDAQNPLDVEINLREMVLTGNTTYNIELRDNDIIYVPPTLIGLITRFIEKLLAPVAVISRALFGFSNVEFAYERLFEDNVGPYRFRF
jgi:protein involved in polysaccharide export with SLBB domain